MKPEDRRSTSKAIIALMQSILENDSKAPGTTPLCFTWDELAAATNGRWSEFHPEFLTREGVSSICTDTRCLTNNSLFLALRGERFDGHNFVSDAAAEGVSAVCVENLSNDQIECLRNRGLPYLLVPNTLEAFQQMALAHRRRFDLPIIAVTGSSGKTSTKEIIGAILKQHFGENVLITHGNTNNQIGVPQNLLKLHHRHRAAVLELGTNSPGEIKTLTNLALPCYAVLTNVGPVHLEGLKSIEGVIKEKSEIFSNLQNSNGCAVIPASLCRHPLIASKTRGLRMITFGVEEHADIQVVYEGGGFYGSCFRIVEKGNPRPMQVTWRLSGEHQALNAAAAVAVVKSMGISNRIIVSALETSRIPSMRMEITWKNNVRWINDAYNANPESMKAFIDWLSTIKMEDSETHCFYVILGDMFELGEDDERYHRDILSHCSEQLPTMILLPVGERTSRAADSLGLPSFLHVDDVKKWLFTRLKSGDSVALKGSRGMALERIIP